MFEEYHEKIASLLLFAVNFRRGDKVQLNIDFDCREIAKRVAELAYGGGALYVDLDYRDQFLQAAAVRGTATEFWFPAHRQAKLSETTGAGWKYVAIRSEVEGDVLEGLRPDRAAEYSRVRRENNEPHVKAIMTNKMPWTVTYVPSDHMAHQAFPELPLPEAIQRYWDAIAAILHLDLDDPREFWTSEMDRLAARSNLMNELGAEALHFVGPGTDLTVGLNRNARWIGGYDRSATGENFLANIPTAEIFTSPDYREVNGRVRFTRPFVMHENHGAVPIDAWLEFREGRVVDFGAARGRDSLEAFFRIDERTRYAGEIALVDPQSPFARTGITYYNGLYDENSACHLALGRAYPFTLREQQPYSRDELLSMGMNVAAGHEDAMIGSSDVNVTAVLPDGTRRDIIRDGRMFI